MTRRELISKLVSSGHLNVEERQIFTTSPLNRAEVEQVVSEVLARYGFFPCDARPSAEGHTAYEGHFITATPDGRFCLHWQRAHPLAPGHIVEATKMHFGGRDEAIRRFIESEWKDQIDGILFDQ